MAAKAILVIAVPMSQGSMKQQEAFLMRFPMEPLARAA